MHRAATLAVAALLAGMGCAPRPRPAPVPPPAPPPPPATPAFTAAEVWTAQPGVVLRGDSSSTTLPWMFMRLAVVRVDSSELVVRCMVCRGFPQGRVPRDRVVYEVRGVADAQKLELPDFALAVRDAARRRDLEALRRVMSRDFVYSLDYPEGVLEAMAAWQGRRSGDIERLPGLLDRGIVSTGGGGIWAAPPEFVTQRGYADLRAGFRRGPNGWELTFLVRPEIAEGLVH
ncbi:hypothetical protein [Longimicrobium sp.]|uniref:hypothetical protein n=1 Tax=Longimicrobium sp. TaxID=2029185 RepID=UPI002C0251A1|nr:hypothetical protein [Longimicrobium sp.]HSU14042.1 hypothetical protein [Longimicrobium sp.]